MNNVVYINVNNIENSIVYNIVNKLPMGLIKFGKFQF